MWWFDRAQGCNAAFFIPLLPRELEARILRVRFLPASARERRLGPLRGLAAKRRLGVHEPFANFIPYRTKHGQARVQEYRSKASVGSGQLRKSLPLYGAEPGHTASCPTGDGLPDKPRKRPSQPVILAG